MSDDKLHIRHQISASWNEMTTWCGEKGSTIHDASGIYGIVGKWADEVCDTCRRMRNEDALQRKGVTLNRVTAVPNQTPKTIGRYREALEAIRDLTTDNTIKCIAVAALRDE